MDRRRRVVGEDRVEQPPGRWLRRRGVVAHPAGPGPGAGAGVRLAGHRFRRRARPALLRSRKRTGGRRERGLPGGDGEGPAQDLPLLAGNGAAVEAGVLGIERLGEGLPVSRREGPDREGHHDLVPLADVAHVGVPRFVEPAALLGPGPGPGHHHRPRLLVHLREQGVDRPGVEVGEAKVAASHHLVGHRGAQHPDRGPDPRSGRHDHAADVELLGEPGRVQRRGAAERDHRPGGDVLPPLDGVDPGRVRHVLVDHLGDGERGERVGEIEGLADRAPDRPGRPLRGEPDRAPRELRRIDAPEDDVGVGHRRPLAAPVVAGGAGVGPRARRPHVEPAHPVHPRDGPSAGPDLHHLDGRNADRKPAPLEVAVGPRHLEGAGHLGFAAVDEADLGRRPAHVEGDRVVAAALAGDLGGEDRSAGRARLDEPDGEAGRVLKGGEAAAGGHEEERAPEAKRPQLGLEAGEVA